MRPGMTGEGAVQPGHQALWGSAGCHGSYPDLAGGRAAAQ